MAPSFADRRVLYFIKNIKPSAVISMMNACLANSTKGLVAGPSVGSAGSIFQWVARVFIAPLGAFNYLCKRFRGEQQKGRMAIKIKIGPNSVAAYGEKRDKNRWERITQGQKQSQHENKNGRGKILMAIDGCGTRFSFYICFTLILYLQRHFIKNHVAAMESVGGGGLTSPAEH